MRRTSFFDLNPQTIESDGVLLAVSFDCPEADGGCHGRHRIPLDTRSACHWRVLDRNLATFTLDPSIRCSGACRWHGFIQGGRVTFCDDSKSGPDWSAR